MTDRGQERAALALFLEAAWSTRSSDLGVQRDDPADFPDFVLLNRATNKEIWVEIVEAVEAGKLIAAERRTQRLYNAAPEGTIGRKSGGSKSGLEWNRSAAGSTARWSRVRWTAPSRAST